MGLNELRTLGPGYRRMREGGRAKFTVFTKVDKKSRRAIQRTWSSFANEASSHKEVFFRHIFNNLTPAQLRSLRRLGVTVDQLVERLSDHRNQAHVRRILSHSKVVEGTKVAADRFFAKNVSGVLYKAAKGRVGFFNLRARGSSRDDIASALLAAIEHHGLPGRVAPPPVRPPIVPPEPPEPPYGAEEPEPTPTPTPPPAEPYGAPYGAEERPSPSLSEHALGEQAINLAELARKGVRHFETRSDDEGQRRHVAKLMDAANAFVGDLFSYSLSREQVTALANHALNATTFESFLRRAHKLARDSERGTTKWLHEVLPHRDAVFQGDPRLTAKNLVDRWNKLKYRRRGVVGGSFSRLSEGQRGAVAFYLLARLARKGADDNETAQTHLKRFVRASHADIREHVQNWWNAAYRPQPRNLSNEELMDLLRASVLHGRTGAGS